MIIWVVGVSAINIKHCGPFEQRGQALSKLWRIRGVIDHVGVIYNSWCHAWSHIVTTSRNYIYYYHHHHISEVHFPGCLSLSETFSRPVKARVLRFNATITRTENSMEDAPVTHRRAQSCCSLWIVHSKLEDIAGCHHVTSNQNTRKRKSAFIYVWRLLVDLLFQRLGWNAAVSISSIPWTRRLIAGLSLSLVATLFLLTEKRENRRLIKAFKLLIPLNNSLNTIRLLISRPFTTCFATKMTMRKIR